MPNIVCILGAGPAGMSASLWLKNFGFETWLLEAGKLPGGMLALNFLNNNWVLGQVGNTGTDLAKKFAAHIEQEGVAATCNAQVEKIERIDGKFRVVARDEAGGQQVRSCVALVIATGTHYRSGEIFKKTYGIQSVPSDRIVCGPYAFEHLDNCNNKRILIIGGGDNAFENAYLLSDRAQLIYLLIRSQPRAQFFFRKRLKESEDRGRCNTYTHSVIAELAMTSEGIRAMLDCDGDEVSIHVDRIHVLAGYAPNTSFLERVFPNLRSTLKLNTDGYVIIDLGGRTSIPGVYAAGDVCNSAFPNVVSALAQGAHAAKSIELDYRRRCL